MPMKNLSGTFKLFSMAAVVICIVACAAVTASNHAGVVYNKDYIVIKPEAQLSPAADKSGIARDSRPTNQTRIRLSGN